MILFVRDLATADMQVFFAYYNHRVSRVFRKILKNSQELKTYIAKSFKPRRIYVTQGVPSLRDSPAVARLPGTYVPGFPVSPLRSSTICGP